LGVVVGVVEFGYSPTTAVGTAVEFIVIGEIGRIRN
jgi:hypothetical protein